MAFIISMFNTGIELENNDIFENINNNIIKLKTDYEEKIKSLNYNKEKLNNEKYSLKTEFNNNRLKLLTIFNNNIDNNFNPELIQVELDKYKKFYYELDTEFNVELKKINDEISVIEYNIESINNNFNIYYNNLQDLRSKVNIKIYDENIIQAEIYNPIKILKNKEGNIIGIFKRFREDYNDYTRKNSVISYYAFRHMRKFMSKLLLDTLLKEINYKLATQKFVIINFDYAKNGLGYEYLSQNNELITISYTSLFYNTENHFHNILNKSFNVYNISLSTINDNNYCGYILKKI